MRYNVARDVLKLDSNERADLRELPPSPKKYYWYLRKKGVSHSQAIRATAESIDDPTHVFPSEK